MATRTSLKRKLKDADLIQTIALPAGASTTVVTTGIDTGVRTNRAVPAEGLAVCLEVPALSTTIAPDTRTSTLSIEASDDLAFGSGVTVLRTAVGTGADGAGIGAMRIDATLPEDCPRYVRGKVVFGASMTTGAALSASCSLLAG